MKQLLEDIKKGPHVRGMQRKLGLILGDFEPGDFHYGPNQDEAHNTSFLDMSGVETQNTDTRVELRYDVSLSGKVDVLGEKQIKDGTENLENRKKQK